MPIDLHVALGVDVGTTNTKVVVAELTSDGAIRETFLRSVPTPLDGRRLRDAVLAAISEAVLQTPGRIRAVGIASMAETGVLVDRDGEPLGDLLRWNDTVTTRAAEELVQAAGASALYEATGVPVAAKSLTAQWLRLRADDDARVGSARWCGAADLIATALSGSWATDHTLAARTMAYRSSPPTAEPFTAFDADLLALAGLTPDRVPEVLPPGEPAGAVTAAAAAATGLPAGIPVVIAGHDHAVGAWATGVRSDGQAADSVGTAEALFRVSAAPLDRAAARRAGMSLARTVDGGSESLVSGNPTAGALVEWALRTMYPDVDREATFAAAEAKAGDEPVDRFVLPYLRGRQSPAPDPRALFRVVDRDGRPATLPADPGSALAVLLRSLALQLAWMDSAQDDVVGAARDASLPMLGGPGAANGAWTTMKRMLVPGRLEKVGSSEPVAVGAAMLALRAVTGLSPELRREPLGDPDATRQSDRIASPDAEALLHDFIDAATRPADHSEEEEHR